MGFLRNSVIAAISLLACLGLKAQEPDTVANLSLDRSVITERAVPPMILNQKGISGTINADKIAAIPSFLGNADPIRFVRLLPSVQVNTEVEGGLYMQGSDHSHTLISQSGVPIYGASHLLGFFSVFNTPHFKGMHYATSAGQESRIGGVIDMQLPDTVARRWSGDFSVGLLSAQGTFDIPMGKSSLKISARRTFINLVYGNILQFAGYPIRYGFTDANLTWTWKPGTRDRVWVDVFGGLDQGTVRGGSVEKMEADWYNALGAVHWNHYFPEATLKQTAYATTFGLDPTMEAFKISGRMESFIRDYGYRSSLKWRDWEFGARYSYYHIQPQNPKSEGHFSDRGNNGMVPEQHAMEASATAQYSRLLGYWLELKAGLGLNWYLSPEKKSYWGLTPEVDLVANLMDAGKLDLRYGLRRQNLFQGGVTNTGLPAEFWMAAGSLQDPQWAHCFSLAYNVQPFQGAWSVSAELYYKLLYNQLEYVGTALDIITGHYDLSRSVLKGHGRAYGVNLMLQRQKGPLTGWISYAFSRSLRTFDDFHDGKEYSSNHERLHELDIVATYDFGRWDVGATFVAASGAPYTRPQSFYVSGSRLVCEYGPYNAERLPAYVKLDVSANWYIKKGPKGKCGLNFSMYNVLGRENAVAYGVHINPDLTAYEFRPMAIYAKFLPSIAFFCTF